MDCEDGCIHVEKILGNFDICDDSDEDINCRYDVINKKEEELNKFQCWEKIKNGDYGHPNYSVMAYASAHGHLDCLIYLNEKLHAHHHYYVSVATAESGQLSCLKYIMEKCDTCTLNINDYNNVTDDECIEYLKKVCK